MSKVSKGNRQEKRCEDDLKAKGYVTWKTRRVQYANIDIFGLFDVVALHPEGKCIRFIQVKSNRCDKPTRVAIQNLLMPKCCSKEIWIWKDYKGWTKLYYGGINECEETDEKPTETS